MDESVSKIEENNSLVELLIEKFGPPDGRQIALQALRGVSSELNRLERWERDSLNNAGTIFIGAW